MKKIKLDKEYVVSNDENDFDKYIFSAETEFEDNPNPNEPKGYIRFYKYMSYKDNSFILACIDLPYYGEGKSKDFTEDGCQSWETFSKWNKLDNYFLLSNNGKTEEIELFDVNDNKLSAEKIIDLSSMEVDYALTTMRDTIEECYIYDDCQRRIIRMDDLKVIALFEKNTTYESCDNDTDVRAINYYVKKYNIKERGIVKNL